MISHSQIQTEFVKYLESELITAFIKANLDKTSSYAKLMKQFGNPHENHESH